ncbi:SelEFf [Scenedesmus sp. NREL 46B-D3]|nr:SelEFf [Scenedesmus sp. NREL 46B-D3]
MWTVARPPLVRVEPGSKLAIGLNGHPLIARSVSAVAAMSSVLSTAALDKHPQSKERGITLDLGFSSFSVPLPQQLQHLSYDALQFTLVDCPGHASLIRTIIGGAQIIDMMVLVIDVTKGFQAQTAECLVVGEIAAHRMVVALNKTDLLPEVVRPKAVKKATKLIRETLAATKFAGAAVIPVSAKPSPSGIQQLQEWLVGGAVQQHADPAAAQAAAAAAARPFLFSIDHCFPLKGQGTILTGTVLQGSCQVGSTVELPALKVSKQVKSMQMFKRPVTSLTRGDRAALCVTQLNAKLLERGLAAAPGTVPTFTAAVAAVDKVRFYGGPVPGKAKYHMSIGHATVMAETTFFGLPDAPGSSQADALRLMIDALSRTSLHTPVDSFDWSQQYLYQDELHGLEGRPITTSSSSSSSNTAAAAGGAASSSSSAAVAGSDARQLRHFGPQWVLLRFDQPVTAPEDSVVIGARLDVDAAGEACRLAFYGRLAGSLGEEAQQQQLTKLQVYKPKQRQGVIARIAPDGMSAVCSGLFKRETDISIFQGARVTTGRGEQGSIEGRFGTSGKFKVQFDTPLWGVEKGQQRSAADNVLLLCYKRFVFDADKHCIRQ